MAQDVASPDRVGEVPDGTGLRICLVCARFNDRVTRRLLDGARRGLDACGVAPGDVTEVWVPGAFEVPIVAKAVAVAGSADAVVGLGCVIRGETSHYDLVAGECARGLQQAGLDTGVPCVFGVLTTEDLDQALARSQDAGGHNVGEEGAWTAVEMARLLARIRRSAGAPGPGLR
ncbi:MAG: 6,7-dimethyl-8-ribityllumazine synthase [Actinobacteria bacterium]|nr:6,7-dimethyl-8-ribityllumazine synthase [Actinomycetota bacterium]